MELQEWLQNELSQDIWKRKYQHDGESLDNWLDRVSAGNTEIKELILAKKFIFAGRILANRGLQHYGKKITYSNCYDIPAPEDNLESIFDTGKYMARTFSYGGGCGTGLYKLRPIGSPVNNAAIESTGSVSFAEFYNVVTKIISQKGRRGATMLFQMVNHPDIETFIKLKSDLVSLEKTNISVGILQDFLNQVEVDGNYSLTFNDTEYKVISARTLLMEIAFQAWDTGDPGTLYWDRINTWSIVSEDDEYVVDAPNPCGEQPLIRWGSCNLVSINLSRFIEKPFTPGAYFNRPAFNKVVRQAVIEMNKLLDEGMDLHPLLEQREIARDWRNIGIGIMGMADALVKLGIRYGSNSHIEFCDTVGSLMIDTALNQSALLAKEDGPYPKYKHDKVTESPFVIANASNDTFELIMRYGLRNCSLLTIAPTGTLSNLWEISGGGEPFYDISYDRLTESLHGEDRHYTVYSKVIEEYAIFNNLQKDEKGQYQGLPDFILNSTAKKLNWKERIKVQATWQRYIDSAISSTINLPKEATVEDVFNIYMYAGQVGCKGITVFREGCRRAGVLSSPKTPEEIDYLEENEIDYKFDYIQPISRHELGETHGSTIDKKTACGKMYITINHDDNNNIVESFITTGKAGMCTANLNAVNRLISLSLRCGIKVPEVVHQLKGIRCDSCRTLIVKGQKLDGVSCADAIGRVLEEKYAQLKGLNTEGVKTGRFKGATPNISNTPKSIDMNEIIVATKMDCPECGTRLRAQGGCPSCPNCGWSSCG